MNLENPTQSQSHLTPAERANITDLVASFRQHFTERGTQKSPFLTLRLRGFLQQVILCDRLETALLTDAKELTPEAAAHLGKAYDRYHRSLKSLEDTANKLTPTAEPRPKSADAANHAAKPLADLPIPSHTPNPTPIASSDTPHNQSQDSPPAAPPTSPTRPTGPTLLSTPPPNPIPPTEQSRKTPQPVIRVPRPTPFVQQQHRR